MAVSTERLEKVGRIFSTLWDERDLEAVRPLYREDAVFISPNPPDISEHFGKSRLWGRDCIDRCEFRCIWCISQ